MTLTLTKKKGNYKKWMTLSPGDVPAAANSESDGADRRLMAHFISPFSLILNRFFILFHDFVKIWKKYKVPRGIQQKIIFEEQFKIHVNEIISSTRQLNHTNAEEKNIIFTYHASSDPEGLKMFLYNYILTNIPNKCNKQDLYFELINEIDKVQKEIRQNKENPTECNLLDQNSSYIPISTSHAYLPSSDPLSPNQTPQQMEVTPSPNQTITVLNESIPPNDKDLLDDVYDEDFQTDLIFTEQDVLNSFDLGFSFQDDNNDTFF